MKTFQEFITESDFDYGDIPTKDTTIKVKGKQVKIEVDFDGSDRDQLTYSWVSEDGKKQREGIAVGEEFGQEIKSMKDILNRIEADIIFQDEQ